MISTYHIWTIGCQMNEADARQVAVLLESLGVAPVDRAAEADLIILNTCVVRQQAEDRIYTRLDYARQLKARNPGRAVALMGCLVGKDAGAVKAQFPFVDVFMPPSDFAPLVEFLRGQFRADAPAEPFMLPSRERGKAVAAYVPVVLGCSHACAFCIIPYRRGAERSRPPGEILDEVRRLAAEGVREVTLLGQIVDRYGLDFDDGTDLPALLGQIASVEPVRRIRFLTSHPNWITDRLLDAVAAEPKICPMFEIPFQSGHDEVLQRMRRGYTADRYRRLIGTIRDRIPGAGISTDIIVGFPGETEPQFMDSCRLLEDLDLDMARIAKYSPRPGTLAARQMPDDVPEAEKERRRVEAERVLRAMLTRKHSGWKGRTVEALIENLESNGRWRGRTPLGVNVFVRDERNVRGLVVPVELDWAGPFSLIGHPAGRGVCP